MKPQKYINNIRARYNAKKPTKLTPEIKQAVTDLIDADQKLRYPEQQPLDSAENQKCRELGLIDGDGVFLIDLPNDIQEFIDQYM